MKQAGRKMGLQVIQKESNQMFFSSNGSYLNTLVTQSHYVGVPGGISRKLCAPVDIEGHQGTDGRYYVVVCFSFLLFLELLFNFSSSRTLPVHFRPRDHPQPSKPFILP